MLLGLLEGIPTMLKGEVAMVTYYYILVVLSFLSIHFSGGYSEIILSLFIIESSLVLIYYVSGFHWGLALMDL